MGSGGLRRAAAVVLVAAVLLPPQAVLAHHVYNPPPHMEGVTPVTPQLGEKKWLTILCRFSDDPSTPHEPAWYRDVMGSSHPGMAHYWNEVSLGQMTIEGTTVVGWYDLPRPRRDYFTDDGLYVNEPRMISDCGGAAAENVHFPDFDGVTFWVNGSLRNVNNRSTDHGGDRWMSFDGTTKLYHSVFISSDHAFPNGVLAHEMGHAFRFGHSGSEHRDQYGSHWDLMSRISRGCSWQAHPDWCVPVHPIAFWKYLAGWLTENDIADIHHGETRTVTIYPLEGPRPGAGYLMARAYTLHSPLSHLTIEARRWRGYDAPLPDGSPTGIPGEGIIVHRVDPYDFSAYALDDSPDELFLQDDEALRTVGETFVDPESGIEIHVESETSDGGYVVRISSPALDDVPNDDVSSATELTDGAVVDQTTYLASAAQDDPISGCNQGKQSGHTVWFRYRAPEDGIGTFSTHGTDDWSLVNAYSGAPGSFVDEGCAVINPIAGSGNGPLEIEMRSGRDYYFVAAPYNRWWEGQDLHVEFSFAPGPISAEPSPSPELSPSPEPTESTEPGPNPEPEPEPAKVHLRTVSMRIVGHLVMTGRVRATDGFRGCSTKMTVFIQERRHGRWVGVGLTTTRVDGTYKARLHDRKGVFRAMVRTYRRSDTERCALARSRPRRHSH